MIKELDKKLIEKYKYMFADFTINNQIVFRFEHNDGWYNLLDDLMGKIEKIDINKTLRITKIKEKFGGLRFYIYVMSETKKSNNEEQIYKLINDAEE